MAVLGKGGGKYHNQPDTRGRILFDSRKGAARYDELMVLFLAGKIRDLNSSSSPSTPSRRAMSATGTQPFSAYLAKKRAEGKHYNVDISHAAKKLMRLIFAMEKSKQPYCSAA